jgi:acetyl-CoA decarbonylase/synthase, CODH/ACS complex subunit delta
MTKKVKLSEMTDMWKDIQILSFEGVTIEGDIEIDFNGFAQRRL